MSVNSVWLINGFWPSKFQILVQLWFKGPKPCDLKQGFMNTINRFSNTFLIRLGHFKCQSETFNFHPLNLNQIANGFFLHRALCFFFYLKIVGPKNPTPFSNLWAPTFWCWCQSARERLRGLKIGIGWFSLTLSLFFEIKNASYALLREYCQKTQKIFEILRIRSNSLSGGF